MRFLLPLAFLSAACGSKSPCDIESIDKVMSAKMVHGRAATVAAALRQQCTAPPALARLLEKKTEHGEWTLANSGQDLARLLVDTPGLWKPACGRDPRMLADGLAKVAQAAQAELTMICDPPAALGVTPDVQLVEGLVVAYIYTWLVDGGVDEARAKSIGRALLGL